MKKTFLIFLAVSIFGQLALGGKQMDPNSVAKLTEWYQAEMQKATSQITDPNALNKKIETLTAEYQKKMLELQSAPATKTAGVEHKPVKFIPAYVEPYYSGPTAEGAAPQKVEVNKQFDSKLKSTNKADVLFVQNELKKNNSDTTPMTFFVLASRLYDVGARAESVFWFYAAKDRLAATKAVANLELVWQAVEAGDAFSSLMGPFINGYAFCNIDQQLATLKSAAEWSKANPYKILLNPKIVRVGIDGQKALNESADDRLKQAEEAKKYFSDAKNRNEIIADRKANGTDKKYCW